MSRQMSDSTPSVPVVEAFEVTKRFGSTAALKDVSIRVMPGESHALVGRNGAGKSTLVNVLTGLRKPDTGEVRFHDETVEEAVTGHLVPPRDAPGLARAIIELLRNERLRKQMGEAGFARVNVAPPCTMIGNWK